MAGFSGATYGFTIGHIAPEASKGGPIGVIREGEIINVDVAKRTLNVEISSDEEESPNARTKDGKNRKRRAMPDGCVGEIREVGVVGFAGGDHELMRGGWWLVVGH